MEAFDEKMLWDDHGIIAGILVSPLQLLIYNFACINYACSHSQHIFHKEIFMSSWCPTYYTKSSKGHLKIIWWSGLVTILSKCMAKPGQQ
jgi:hypothetical protein